MSAAHPVPSPAQRLVSFAALAAAYAPAQAHHGMDGATPQTLAQGLISGLAHPVIGLDHLAFLVVAALLACALTGASRWLVPLVFVAATVAGTALHLGSADIPLSETLVATTVLVGAVLLATRSHPGALTLSALFAVGGILHGYAYGESIVGAEPTPLVAYLAGFALVQYALIAGGSLALDAIAERSPRLRQALARIATGAAFLAGGAFFVFSIA